MSCARPNVQYFRSPVSPSGYALRYGDSAEPQARNTSSGPERGTLPTIIVTPGLQLTCAPFSRHEDGAQCPSFAQVVERLVRLPERTDPGGEMVGDERA